MPENINNNGLDDLYESGHQDPDTNHSDVPNQISDEDNYDRERQRVRITSDAPVVIFFGPRAIGKSVALIRLARYLRDEGYQIDPDTSFRNNDSAYRKLCNSFQRKFMNTDKAPDSNDQVNFLLLKVNDGTKVVCQFLEAPGEHYFNMANIKEEPNVPYLPYFTSIINSRRNLKVYIFFLELNWDPEDVRPTRETKKDPKETYDEKISKFISNRVKSRDSIILMCNKADKSIYFHRGKPNLKSFKKEIENQYTQTHAALGKKKKFGFLKSISIPYQFVVFSAGDFNRGPLGVTYEPGDELYPKRLWNAIKKSIRGRWF